jgi:cytochrome bd ubiquinol oxidase subunit II
MSLADVPAILALVGLAAYAVLGGADFGAGFWQLTPGPGARSRAIREHAYRAMGPVWEANHVWLIFVLVVCWTAYPVAFGSIASTLSFALFIAAVGIILRGTAYALRSGAGTLRGQRRIELVFALSSILTPFALGAAVGGIASGRVPVGNAKGDLVTSWLNPPRFSSGHLPSPPPRTWPPCTSRLTPSAFATQISSERFGRVLSRPAWSRAQPRSWGSSCSASTRGRSGRSSRAAGASRR